ncbi:MAG: hypothetical protein U0176_09395 [Bacteroidia bacterium]
MSDFLSKVLPKINCDPSRIGELFSDKLTIQEELMLTKLFDELGLVVERAMDMALASANAANNGEIQLGPEGRQRIIYFTAVRASIYRLIEERGTFRTDQVILS